MNIKPILFLDKDGVCNSAEYFKSPEYKKRRHENKDDMVGFFGAMICPEMISNLNEVIRLFDFNIVISSSWRHHENALKAIELCGIDNYKERFLGITPSNSKLQRGGEIKQWIQNNGFKGKYIVIDDDSDMDDVRQFFFQTTWENGLNTEYKEKLIEFCAKILK